MSESKLKLFSYHTNLTHDGLEPEIRLITLWRHSWMALGVEPVVLNEWHARQHPMFERFDEAVRDMPTVNHPEYERACYLRWLALAQAGGGFMADYDVFPKCGEFPKSMKSKGRLYILQQRGPCPSFVYASKETAEWVCEQFMTGQFGKRAIDGRDHYSDMYCLEDMWGVEEKKAEKERRIQLFDHVLGYMDEGWEKARFVHFSNGSMQPRGLKPRWKHIPTLLKIA